MGLQDLIITPIYFFLFILGAYIYRNKIVARDSKVYFLPAFIMRLIGALMVGIIYHFYYNGGDTFNFFDGSGEVYRALLGNPKVGLKLLLSNSKYDAETFEYAQNIAYYTEPSAFFIVKVGSILSLITFHTYSANALFFAVFSFSGQWALFNTFKKVFGYVNRSLAIIILFIPSMIFWGSGLLKDTVTIGALSWTIYLMYEFFYFRKRSILKLLALLFFGYIILIVKAYIIIILLASFSVWIYSINIQRINNSALRNTLRPLLIVTYLFLMYYSAAFLTAGDLRYSLDGIAERTRINAYDIYYRASKEGASSYYLGELDGTFTGMIGLFPQAVNVSLFRPYLWEANNVLMLFSSLESMIILVLTIYVLLKRFKHIFFLYKNPHFRFCVLFAISFAFGVGISTYNFGSLVRYKIPLLPFFLLAIYMVWVNKNRNVKRTI